MLLAVYISMSSIGLDMHVQIHLNTFWFILCVLFANKISSDKAKINVIKNVKNEKAVFYDVMIWLINELFYKTLKMAT